MNNAIARRPPATGLQQVLHARQRPKRARVATTSRHGRIDDPRNEFSEEEWKDMVATAAYYRAERRGFEDGSADEDWYEAEAALRERFSAEDGSVEAAETSGGGATDIETKGE